MPSAVLGAYDDGEGYAVYVREGDFPAVSVAEVVEDYLLDVERGLVFHRVAVFGCGVGGGRTEDAEQQRQQAVQKFRG